MPVRNAAYPAKPTVRANRLSDGADVPVSSAISSMLHAVDRTGLRRMYSAITALLPLRCVMRSRSLTPSNDLANAASTDGAENAVWVLASLFMPRA